MPHVRALQLVASPTPRPSHDAGDDYEQLLLAHWAPLVRYARGILGATDGADDAVQEAFIALWERREPLAPDRVAPFLYRAVRHRALNERRWHRVRELWRDGRRHEPPLAPPADEEERTDRRVREAVAALPRRRREVFELARQHGLSYQQIALTLSMAPQTVANHMSAALRDLRRSLADLLDPAADPPAGADW